MGITYTTGVIQFTLCGHHLHYRCHSVHSVWALPVSFSSLCVGLPVSFSSLCVGTTGVIQFTLCGHYQCHSVHSVWTISTGPALLWHPCHTVPYTLWQYNWKPKTGRGKNCSRGCLPSNFTHHSWWLPPPPPKKKKPTTPLPLNCDISITYHWFRAKVTSQTNVTQKVLQHICDHILITS